MLDSSTTPATLASEAFTEQAHSSSWAA